MVEKPLEGSTYWYCHSEILTEFPKQVTVVNVTPSVIVCDSYIGQEKFGSLPEVSEALFLTEEEANEFFIKLSVNGKIHFIDRKDDRYNKIYNHFVEVNPSILI